jgi:glycosyltransferase involved in cell wall biosynthesis
MARLVEHKGVADLIAAIGRADGCVLVVAGDGPDRERLEQLAAGAAPGRVHFLGMVSGDPAPFFAALDVFALPSHSEGFGLVLIEAAMRHVPVIGTRIGGIEDAVVEGETGMLVTMADSAEMACAINKLRSSPELRSRLAEAAFRRAMSEFTEQAMGEAEEAVLLGKSRSK